MINFINKKSKYDESLKGKTQAVFDNAEKLLLEAIKASGLDITDIADADDDSIILFKRYMEIMRDAEELAIAQAEQLDKINALDVIIQNQARIMADIKSIECNVDILVRSDKKTTK